MNHRIRIFLFLLLSFICFRTEGQQLQIVDYVNPFIGSTNYGTTNPGALVPQGLMSVVPFNVMGSTDNKRDKDDSWWSTPYTHVNSFFTGYSHVNLSGVGCPDMGSLLLMPTTGALNVDYKEYGSAYTDEKASPGYYSNRLSKYNILTEVSATARVGIAQFTFPKGASHIILNLGEGLTNESGATIKKVNDTEFEGSKLLGTFCYNPEAVYPIYFVMRINKTPKQSGYFKKQRLMKGAEHDWDINSGKYKLYTNYTKELSGDDVGAYFSFETTANEIITVQIGVSFVSIENARLNLNTEQATANFEDVHQKARKLWNDDLSRIKVEGGTHDQKVVFYTGLYHVLIHPNILQDVNGQYPAMESGLIKTTSKNRYTVFSLWDTYRNVHQLMTLVYPERQMDMVNSMLDMYTEHGWLPKWELFGRETLTMEGDPSIPVLVDTWRKGLRNFDVDLAYEAMRKGATTPGAKNLLRPDIDDYITRGYVPMTAQYDNSVSHALEYYLADWNLSQLAKDLGKTADAKLFYDRSMGYKNYYSKEFGTFRPIKADGQFYTPFDPLQGANFAPSPGFHEGNAWNYTFYVPHDVLGLAQLMGGKNAFVTKLQQVFDKNYFDVSNEPDIAYPHLFSYFKGEEWRTQKQVRLLLDKHFTNSTGGIPGNDDTGTLSAWAVFNMLGFYPDCPGQPDYTVTAPIFDKVTIQLDPTYYSSKQLIIETNRSSKDAFFIQSILIDGKKKSGYRLNHSDLTQSTRIKFNLIDSKK